MIRREYLTAEGKPAWLLISQVEHARLAGELVRDWGTSEIPAPNPAGVVVPTIARHDDGWQAWELRPEVDAKTGRPRSFMEMPHAEAHRIWWHSIEALADLSPLSQYMVATHFASLRRHGVDTHVPGSPGDLQTNDANPQHDGDLQLDIAVKQFLAKADPARAAWLAAWQAENRAENTLAVAQQAVELLQAMDRFSLWLCMAERTERWELTALSNLKIEFQPLSPDRIAVTPWPWHGNETRRFSVQGTPVPLCYYGDATELAHSVAKSSPVQITWEFTPETA